MTNYKAEPSTLEAKTLLEIEDYSRRETDELLSKYQAYNAINIVVAGIEKDIQDGHDGKEEFKGGWLMGGSKMASHDPHAHQKQKIKRLLQEQNEIGLSMKFQNPLIWAMYKFEAYALESGAIRTVGDLVLHCHVDGICHKRISYINTWLRSYGEGKSITDGLFKDSTLIPEMYKDEKFMAMLIDSLFMKGWLEFENHEQGKWYGYKED